jgi:hypothetical protein
MDGHSTCALLLIFVFCDHIRRVNGVAYTHISSFIPLQKPLFVMTSNEFSICCSDDSLRWFLVISRTVFMRSVWAVRHESGMHARRWIHGIHVIGWSSNRYMVQHDRQYEFSFHVKWITYVLFIHHACFCWYNFISASS